MNLFLDTYALFEVVNGTDDGRKVLRRVKESSRVYTSPLNLYELWYLVERKNNARQADSVVFSIKNVATPFPVSEQACVLAARLKSAHHGKGIGAVDFITAASAIISGSVILTGDKHFLKITEAKAEII